MEIWSCPACGREFGRRGRSHTCIPAVPVEGYIAGRPDWEQPIFSAVVEACRGFGPVIVEAVNVGLFFKGERRNFAELRPKHRRLELSFLLPRVLDDARIRRFLRMPGGRGYHFMDLVRLEDVDAQVTAWLLEAYVADAEGR